MQEGFMNVIEVLQKYQRQLDPDGIEVGVSRQALDELIQAYLDQQWIPVSERLPKTKCLAYTPEQDETMQYRIIPAGFLSQAATDATHWMPLPPPPEGE